MGDTWLGNLDLGLMVKLELENYTVLWYLLNLSLRSLEYIRSANLMVSRVTA